MMIDDETEKYRKLVKKRKESSGCWRRRVPGSPMPQLYVELVGHLTVATREVPVQH
jgi:hypothetical protein